MAKSNFKRAPLNCPPPTTQALDLGSTNFRVILLELSGGRIAREEVSYYSVEEGKRLGPGAGNSIGSDRVWG